MKTTHIFSYFSGLLVLAFAMTSCDTGYTNTNVRNANSNTAVVTNTSATPVANKCNANVSREEYDKNKAECEREKGSSTIGQGINDSWLWFKTKTALATTSDLRDSTINVDVVNDAVTLKGTVETAAQKTKAEQVAKAIDGVKSVKNELMVKPNDSITNQTVNGNSSNRKSK